MDNNQLKGLTEVSLNMNMSKEFDEMLALKQTSLESVRDTITDAIGTLYECRDMHKLRGDLKEANTYNLPISIYGMELSHVCTKIDALRATRALMFNTQEATEKLTFAKAEHD
ncbi:hypothetical protein [Vibrio barjaei]|uniref:hypothetical protein n=1 Tax=Vibrio barjaei TaxID=1676683 RepID=UPI0022845939|nr:hypothetical protein [Vibrio barjaei]MCY9874607.1 hypothetical protein [Vibrio barjaei]